MPGTSGTTGRGVHDTENLAGVRTRSRGRPRRHGACRHPVVIGAPEVARLLPGHTGARCSLSSVSLFGNQLAEGVRALSLGNNNNTGFSSVRGTADGVLFTEDMNNARLWLIDKGGILRRIAGDPTAASASGDGGPALLAGFGTAFSLDVAPDNTLMIYEREPTSRIRRIRPPGPLGFAGPTTVPSEDGQQTYDFSGRGYILASERILGQR